MKQENKKKAVVLLSGGLDSTTALAVALSEGYSCYGLSFAYGQRHGIELAAAKKIAEKMGVVRHLVVRLDFAGIGASALTSSIKVPKSRTDQEMADGIPVTYVPARNTIFLAHALAWAEVLGVPDIFIGVNAVDYSGYPDCRPEYIESFEKMANLAIKAAVEKTLSIRIRAPLLHLRKADIIRKGTELGVDYSLTRSCYDPDAQGRACGRCDSCQIRKKGFKAAGIPDPTRYSHP